MDNVGIIGTDMRYRKQKVTVEYDMQNKYGTIRGRRVFDSPVAARKFYEQMFMEGRQPKVVKAV